MKKIIVVLTILSLITLQHYTEITRFFESVWQGDNRFNPTLYANVELKYKEATVFLLTLTNAPLPEASSQNNQLKRTRALFSCYLKYKWVYIRHKFQMKTFPSVHCKPLPESLADSGRQAVFTKRKNK